MLLHFMRSCCLCTWLWHSLHSYFPSEALFFYCCGRQLVKGDNTSALGTVALV